MEKILLLICFYICAITAQDDLEVVIKLQKKIQDVIKKVEPAYVSIGGGAGVIISSDGYIITNDHVVGDIDTWIIRTGTQKTFECKVIGRDKVGDICLLKIINNNLNLSFLELANSNDLKKGQKVLAFGNPFLYSTDGTPSVSMGVISALHCYQDNYGDAIQTDASLNPGNSGGPLVDLDGNVIGICGRIASRFQNRRSSGVGFAISSNQIKNFLPLLKLGKKIIHGQIIATFSEYYNQGVFVETSVNPLLQPGDIILAINQTPTHNIDLLYGKIWTFPAHEVISCIIKRKDKVFIQQLELEKLE